MENLHTTDCIRTYTGLYMNVFDPTMDMICIEDIAHALSQIPRFGGHLPEFFSVGQHSINCSLAIEEDGFKEHALAALLHDAAEAYMLDMPKPIKKRLPQYNEIEKNLMCLIFQKFGVDYPLDPKIKEIDNEMLQIEWDDLMFARYDQIKPLSPKVVEKGFLNRYESLINN